MNIGARIKNVLQQKGHTAMWLADRIPCERSNVYNIFKRQSINIELLYDLSVILEHDFFKELSDEFRLSVRELTPDIEPDGEPEVKAMRRAVRTGRPALPPLPPGDYSPAVTAADTSASL